MSRRIYTRTATTGGYSNRITQQMQNEADRILQDFRNQLAKDLVKQTDAMAQIIDNFSKTGNLDFSPINLNDFSSLLPVAFKYLVRPQASTTVQESSRSQASQQQFRLSQSQAAAEAAATLANAQKNT